MRTSVSGLQNNPIPDLPRELPQGIPGPYNPEINIGSVTEAMFSGTSNIVLLAASKQQGCSEPQPVSFAQNLQTQLFTFGYTNVGNGYTVTVPNGVTVVNVQDGYQLSGNTLLKNVSD